MPLLCMGVGECMPLLCMCVGEMYALLCMCVGECMPCSVCVWENVCLALYVCGRNVCLDLYVWPRAYALSGNIVGCCLLEHVCGKLCIPWNMFVVGVFVPQCYWVIVCMEMSVGDCVPR